MLQTEFLRNLNSNYERLLLESKPEEKKYQYCILSRGGIKGLLPCSLRYINGLAYLYYDITSRQNIAQIYGKRPLTRQWVKDFMWSFHQIQLELARFLLDEQNVLWYPQQIFQDLDDNVFAFLYVPYYEGDNGFSSLLEFMVEHIDYEDEVLVEFVYKMYEQFETNGIAYLGEQIFEDAKVLDTQVSVEYEEINESLGLEMDKTAKALQQDMNNVGESKSVGEKHTTEKKGLFSLLDSKKKKQRESRDNYQKNIQSAMSGYAVAEETIYEEEDWGKTIYIEETAVEKEKIHCLYTIEGKLMAQLKHGTLTIGKKKEEVDLVLEDLSISRMHARIIKDQDAVYIEDLNSTNGTYKNGLRMQPYEKRKLEEGDEIKLGKSILIYR